MIDLGLLTLVLFSLLLGLWRGMVREVLSLSAWALSFWLASHWMGLLSDRLVHVITSSSVRHWVAWALLMVCLRILFELVLKIIQRLVHLSGLKGLDRVFGALFGMLRGVLVCILLAIGIHALDMAAAGWWQSAQLRPALEHGAALLRPLLPSF